MPQTTRTHGTWSAYNHGRCRCEPCTRAAATHKRAQYARRAQAGVGRLTLTCATCLTTFHRDKPRTYCSRTCYRTAIGQAPHREFWMPRDVRLTLYDRDGWRCRLCGDPVDMTADPNHDNAPTLDHIIPRARGGTDHPNNLRLAHRACNTHRGAEPLTLL